MGILKGVHDSIQVKVEAVVNLDNGRTQKVPFVIKSKKPLHDEQVAILSDIDTGKVSDDELIRDYLQGWHGLQGADGQEVPYDDDSLAEVMQAPEYRKAVIEGIMQAIIGKAALEKNSQRRGAAGR